MTATIRQALLLCAGVGSRLRPLTDVLPKCLMPIHGRPLLDLWLAQLAEAGIEDIVVNVHHHAERVADHVLAGPHADRVTISHEEDLLGTAGTLGRHAERFGGTFVLAHADNLSIFDLGRMAERHAARDPRTLLTMMTFDTDDPRSCGIVEVDGADRVVAFHEKVADPPGRRASAAVFVAEPEVARLAAGLGPPPVDFSASVVPRLIGRIQTFHNAIYHRDIGTPSSLARAQFEWPLALAGDGRMPKHDLWSDADLRARFSSALAFAFSPGAAR